MISNHLMPRSISFIANAILLLAIIGCKTPYRGGTPIQPQPLGSVVDAVNQIQEENAEFAKLIVYAHEFELNQPRKRLNKPRAAMVSGDQVFQPGQTEPMGFRLNDAGVDHVRQIANFLRSNPDQTVVVEQSDTSRKWNTLYQYPVHPNPALDEQRRAVVVSTLESLGIHHANELVIVSRAFPTGQHSQEAARAYQTLWGGAAGGVGGGAGMGNGGSQR